MNPSAEQPIDIVIHSNTQSINQPIIDSMNLPIKQSIPLSSLEISPPVLFGVICTFLSFRAKLSLLTVLSKSCRSKFADNRAINCQHDHLTLAPDIEQSIETAISLLEYVDHVRSIALVLSYEYDMLGNVRDVYFDFIDQVWHTLRTRPLPQLRSFAYEGPIAITIRYVTWIWPTINLLGSPFNESTKHFTFADLFEAVCRTKKLSSISILLFFSYNEIRASWLTSCALYCLRDVEWYHDLSRNVHSVRFDWTPLKQLDSLLSFHCDGLNHWKHIRHLKGFCESIDDLIACLPSSITNLHVGFFNESNQFWSEFRTWKRALSSPHFLPHLSSLHMDILPHWMSLWQSPLSLWASNPVSLTEPLATVMTATETPRPITSLTVTEVNFTYLSGLNNLTTLVWTLADPEQLNLFSEIDADLLPSLTSLTLRMTDHNEDSNPINLGPLLRFLTMRRMRLLNISARLRRVISDPPLVTALASLSQMETLKVDKLHPQDFVPYLHSSLPLCCWMFLRTLSLACEVTLDIFNTVLSAAPMLKSFTSGVRHEALSVVCSLSKHRFLEELTLDAQNNPELDEDKEVLLPCRNNQHHELQCSSGSLSSSALRKIHIQNVDLNDVQAHFLLSKLSEAPCLEMIFISLSDVPTPMLLYMLGRLPHLKRVEPWCHRSWILPPLKDYFEEQWVKLTSEQQRKIQHWDIGDYLYPTKQETSRIWKYFSK